VSPIRPLASCLVLSCLKVIVDVLEFSPLERKIYDSIYVRAKRDFDQLNAKGLVSRNYTHILAMLMRYAFTLTPVASTDRFPKFEARRPPPEPRLVSGPGGGPSFRL
jgi:hypothetical protein